MSALTRLAILASLVVSAMPVVAGDTYANPERACATVRKVIGAHDGLDAAKAQKSWFCDFIEGDYDAWTVVALRSYRRCDGICSNRRGWFAIHKITGEVRDFHVADMEVGDERSAYRPNNSLERSRER